MPRPIYPKALTAYLNMTEEQRFEFDERAAIIEYDGNTPRLIAEKEALRQIEKEQAQ